MTRIYLMIFLVLTFNFPAALASHLKSRFIPSHFTSPCLAGIWCCFNDMNIDIKKTNESNQKAHKRSKRTKEKGNAEKFLPFVRLLNFLRLFLNTLLYWRKSSTHAFDFNSIFLYYFHFRTPDRNRSRCSTQKSNNESYERTSTRNC